ncbi:MAG TPA: SgcJ/EcaC family oxidoreductase [Burkholderiales bacterium]|nr:SgcJ/EcaC family oxidoreductase [Burkholderiales bacterium]
MNADERRIRDLIAQWHRATAAGNVDAILRLMSEDVVFLVPGKPPMQGRDQFEKGLRGLLKSHRIESSGKIEEVRVAGDLAYSWTTLTVRITPLSGGDGMERSGSALSVFRKQANGTSWLLVRDANLLPPA